MRRAYISGTLRGFVLEAKVRLCLNDETTTMRIHQDMVDVSTSGPGPTDVTERVRDVVSASGVITGMCTVFVQHTSAGLVIQENADPAVLRDLARWLAKLAPESAEWEHDDEGPDDMPAHARSVITRTSESIPVRDGELALGVWQAIYLWEFRRHPHRRHLVVHIAGLGPTRREEP
jgi:secondary thiamine-phosphate synthase enzyme